MCFFFIQVYCLFVINNGNKATASVDYCEIEKTKCKGLKHIGCNPEVMVCLI